MIMELTLTIRTKRRSVNAPTVLWEIDLGDRPVSVVFDELVMELIPQLEKDTVVR